MFSILLLCPPSSPSTCLPLFLFFSFILFAQPLVPPFLHTIPSPLPRHHPSFIPHPSSLSPYDILSALPLPSLPFYDLVCQSSTPNSTLPHPPHHTAQHQPTTQPTNNIIQLSFTAPIQLNSVKRQPLSLPTPCSVRLLHSNHNPFHSPLSQRLVTSLPSALTPHVASHQQFSEHDAYSWRKDHWQMDDHLDGYYYTGQTPFRKPNESAFRFHARRLIAIQTLGRLEYQVEEAETKFNRALGPVELTFVGLGAVIGTGVFVLMGTAASTNAGPSVTLSFILGGVVSGIAALSYAEMASMIPIAGSAYTYAYASIGELAAWIIGWDLILEYMVGAATVSVGWSAYVVAFLQDAFNVSIPKTWTKAPINWENSAFHLTGAHFNAPAFVISLAVTTIIYFGIHMTARINNVFVVFKVLVLIIVMFSMIPFVRTEHYHPYFPPEFGGVKGMLEGASTVFFAYIGFDSVSTTAQEARDPQVNLPIGIMATIVIATIIYVGISVVTVGVADYHNLNGDSPMVDAVRLTGMKWLVLLTELGALAATTSVILVLLIAQPRVLYAMANDGLVPRLFANVHPTYKTPSTSTLISGILCAFCGGLLPIQVLSEISSVGTIFAYFVVNIGVIILRYTRKTVPRRFKVPGGPFLLPGLGAASSLLLLQGAKQDAIIRLLVWMAIGLLVYVFYGRRHSEINNPRLDEQSMRVIHENFSTNSLNYNGYLDDDLRQQYARQVARQMDYDQPRRRRSDYSVDGRPSSEHGIRDLGHSYEMSGLPLNGSSPFDDGLSDGAVDSGHGVGAPTTPSEGHLEAIEDVIDVPEHLSGQAEVKDQSTSNTRSSTQPLQASPQTYPEMAHVSPGVS